MRREISRRRLLTDELGRAGMEVVRQLPSLTGLLGMALKESAAARDARLVRQVWELMAGRAPKPEERTASMELVRGAESPEALGDALVDVLWALGQTTEFEQLGRTDQTLVEGLYRIALRRGPSGEELRAALAVLAEAGETPSRVAALEGMFTGLIRSGESVLRKEPFARRVPR